MARASDSSKNKPAAQAGTKQSASGKRRKPKSSTASTPDPVIELEDHPDTSITDGPDSEAGATPMADRYYELAETMNARGAIELAVPFYRQALALLLEERKQLRELLPEAQGPRSAVIPEAEVQGLLTEATALTGVDLEARIVELEEELTAESAQQVLVGLDELAAAQGDGTFPAAGHNLRGKALLLLGEATQALAEFGQAREAEPQSPLYAINLAAALLTQKRHTDALALLRPLYAKGLAALPEALQQPLLRNLATAARQAGHLLESLQVRRQWLTLDSRSVGLDRWLQWAGVGLQQELGDPARAEALALLQDLHRLHPGERQVMQALAGAWEAQGEYRQAALLYRDLLRL